MEGLIVMLFFFGLVIAGKCNEPKFVIKMTPEEYAAMQKRKQLEQQEVATMAMWVLFAVVSLLSLLFAASLFASLLLGSIVFAILAPISFVLCICPLQKKRTKVAEVKSTAQHEHAVFSAILSSAIVVLIVSAIFCTAMWLTL